MPSWCSVRGVQRAAAAVAVAAVGLFFLRDVVAGEIVNRGDDFYRSRQLDDAAEHYARALWFSQYNTVAGERYVFMGALMRSPRAWADAGAVADRQLARYPAAVDVRRARAMLYTVEKRYTQALADWQVVANDPQVPRDVRASAVGYVVVTGVRSGHRDVAERYRYVLAVVNPALERELVRSMHL